MPAPTSYAASVALTGSAQNLTIVTAPADNSFVLRSFEVTTTSSTDILVQVKVNGTAVFEAYIKDGVSMGAESLDVAAQPGQVLSLALPSGTGNVAYDFHGN